MALRQALVVAGHGSHLNPHAAIPVHAHADAIRDSNHFRAVREAFWKEEPAVGEVLPVLDADVVYVVPLFMSEGYFTDRVLPRELRLAARRSAMEVRYTPPVGTHESMADVILHRALSIVGDEDIDDGTALVIVGHGTPRHTTSGRSTREHAATIRGTGRFDEVHALFMDEEPYVSEYLEHVGCDGIVIVPFFVANGYHTNEDLPQDLRLTDDPSEGFCVPSRVDGRRVWYSGAVGTDPRMAEVILERAIEAGATRSRNDRESSSRVGSTPIDAQVETLRNRAATGIRFDGLHVDVSGDRYRVTTPDARRSDLDVSAFFDVAIEHSTYVSNWYFWTEIIGRLGWYRYAFLRWLERADAWSVPERYARLHEGIARSWGQLHIAVELDENGSRRYSLRHTADRDTALDILQPYQEPGDAREIARFDDDGRFRPLKSVPSLATGWIFPRLDGPSLVQTIDFFYPASVSNWHLERRGELDVVDWREAADRQTGIYEPVGQLSPLAVECATEACCVDSQCIKRRRWEFDEETPIGVPSGAGEIPCREPCSLFIAGAREWLMVESSGEKRRNCDAEHATHAAKQNDEAVREAEFSAETNRYRIRYLQARRAAEGE